MTCNRCGAPSVVKQGRFAGKLCQSCVQSLAANGRYARSMRMDPRHGWVRPWSGAVRKSGAA
jgi:hypothetical protein